MGNCKDCVHWDGVWKTKQGTAECTMPEYSDSKDADKSPMVIEFSADDDSGMNLRIMTKPDFGCKAFEQQTT